MTKLSPTYVVHQFWQDEFLHPLGAQPTGGRVRLVLKITNCIEEGSEQLLGTNPAAITLEEKDKVQAVFLHYSYGLKKFHTGCIRMQRRQQYSEKNGDSIVSSVIETADLPSDWKVDLQLPDESGLLFYWFELLLDENRHIFVARNSLDETAWGLYEKRPEIQPESESISHPFQLTVVEENFRTPSWLHGAQMYQIFPDRFARGSNFSFAQMKAAKQGEEYLFHEAWTEDVDFKGTPATGYLACDFYGGQLRGIIENLDHLKRFNIDLLYLNPIVKARSNHRYDAADYFRVDPVLGDLADFRDLCREAKSRGIRVVLDGVFSHTGADSIYFNREGRYDEVGAYQEMQNLGQSSYRGWYNMYYRPDGSIDYNSWWGFPDLPTLRKEDLSLREFICGENGVLAFWLRQGADGFRLDVSDELPDFFLAAIYRRVKKENPDAMVLGEVWEDASHKVSYGEYRDFALGHTHDCVMNYPLSHAVLNFFAGHRSAWQLQESLRILEHDYSKDFLYSCMNFLSTHDTVRALNRLAAIEQPQTREEQFDRILSKDERLKAERRLRLSYLFLYFYPGVVSLYYGDEIAAEGFRDPFNRRPMDWSLVNEKNSHLQALQAMSALRVVYPVLRSGRVAFKTWSERRFVLKRYLKDGLDAFEQNVSGVDEVYLCVNDGPDEWILQGREIQEAFAKISTQAAVPYQLQIPPYSALSLCGKEIRVWQ